MYTVIYQSPRTYKLGLIAQALVRWKRLPGLGLGTGLKKYPEINKLHRAWQETRSIGRKAAGHTGFSWKHPLSSLQNRAAAQESIAWSTGLGKFRESRLRAAIFRQRMGRP